jgi:cytosine/adenosine deaminase-related metal-dependent hydrolase
MLNVVCALSSAFLVSQQADSLAYVVLNHDRAAGEMQVLATADSTVVKFQYVDRNRGPRVETHYRFARDGTLTSMESRGLGTDFFQKAQSETFRRVDGVATWVSSADSGRTRAPVTALYRARTPTPYDDALLARVALQQASRTVRLLPEGTVRAEVLADTIVSYGGMKEHIRLVAVSGAYTYPVTVWLDDRDALFSSASSWFLTVRRGWESTLPVLRSIEYASRTRRSAELAARLTKRTGQPLVIRNADLFDSERGTIRPRTTIVVQGDRITAVGPTDSIAIPEGAQVVDATGKTVLPGMWDMHTHLDFLSEEDGLLQLAAGITTVRDLASDIDDAVSRRDRTAQGKVLGPREILAGFMDGPGAWAGPTRVLIRTEAEARAAIARYDSLGYKQIKVYNLIHPDLIPVIAAETHKRGMRLSGHVARGLSVPAAVTLGYDEIQHAAYLFSTFFPDSLFVPRMRSYGQVAAAVLPKFDLEGGQMTSLISFLREHGTVIDGTFNAWLDSSLPLSDGGDVVFGHSLEWLPPVMRRELSSNRSTTPEERAIAATTNKAYLRLAKRLFDGGVTLVAGTDNAAGLSFHGELEIYERAGIPAPSVLQIATIVPARVMKDDKDYGSVVPGKVADIVIVNGKPTEHITDLRKTEFVVRAGQIYSARDLYNAVGVRPVP